MAPPIYRFGDFELDGPRYELRRNGRVQKLERIPMDLLILLLEKQGEVLTRQEIVARLWGKDVFVDTEHGINTAVRKIRQVLRDDPEQPRFVLTVTGRGYRFVGQSVGGPETEAAVAPSVAPPAPLPEPRLPSGRPLRTSFPARTAVLAVVLICALAAGGFAYWRRAEGRSGKSPSHIMLVVLPFENLSGDPAENYFTDGLTEEIIAQLGSLSPEHLGVIARTTSMAYKGTAKSVQQIGNELGVDYALESSVRRDGDRLRITVQLVRARDQVHVWARNYDRHVSGSIALQEEVARAVADQIEVKLGRDYVSRPARARPDSQANEAYLRGRFFFNQFTADGYRKAITYFQQAIDRDPDFAEAYAGLADCYRFLVITDSISPAEGSAKIADAARQAVHLGDSLAESHSAFAEAMMHTYRWSDAEEEFKRAIALNPSYSDMHRIYAALLAAELRHREAWEQINEAMRTDPLSLPNNAELVRTLYYARDYDGALVQAQKAMQLDPDYYRTHFWMARVYSQKHMYKEAVAEAEIVQRAVPGSNLALTEMAYSLAAAGHQAEARKILRQLEQRATSHFTPAYNLAAIHVALGENDAAMKCLEQSYDEGDWAILVLACEPRFDPLRNSARFRTLLAKLAFPS